MPNHGLLGNHIMPGNPMQVGVPTPPAPPAAGVGWSLDHEAETTTNQTNVTWSGVTCAGPLIVVVAHYHYSSLGSCWTDRVQIDANDATFSVRSESGGGYDIGCDIWWYDATSTGPFSSVDVLVDHTRSADGFKVAVYSITGITPAVATDTDWAEVNATSETVTITGSDADSVTISGVSMDLASGAGTNYEIDAGHQYRSNVESDFWVGGGAVTGVVPNSGVITWGTGTSSSDRHNLCAAMWQ